MKIVLIVPEFLSGSSFLQPPVGLLTCATMLEREGHSVDVIDMRVQSLPLQWLARRILGADFVVITTTPYDQVQNFFVDYRLHYAIRTINFLKERFPGVPLAVCGSHGTIRPDLIVRDSQADIVIIGEYELTITRLARAIAERVSLETVPNIVLRIDSSDFYRTPEDPEALHLVIPDDLMPAYDKVDMYAYYGDLYMNNEPVKGRHWATIQGSRGCPYSCSFCFNFWGKQVRKRSVESVVSEMKLLEQEYHVEQLFFIDFTFTLDRVWVLDICEQVRKEGLKIHWSVETRCDLIDRELAQMMAKANCRRVWLGVESFDENIVRGVGKYNSTDVIDEAIDAVKLSGIDLSIFIMLGLPGETSKTLNKTIRSVYNFKTSYTKSIIVSTPRFGTMYYELAKREYPYLGSCWEDLNAVKGLVANEMRPSILQKAISILKDRSFIYKPTCPEI